MNRIAFIDIEVEPTSGNIQDIGCVKNDGSLFHRNSLAAFAQCIEGAQFVCGHNIINHDLNYVGQTLSDAGIKPGAVIDTLFLSPLLFPSKPYHALLKDDKLQYDEANNPLNDAIKAKDLFYDEVASFNQLDEGFKAVCYVLLHNKPGFGAFFDFLNYKIPTTSTEVRIRERFGELICEKADLLQPITDQPVALAYCLALIHANSRYSITPRWVIKNYPEVERIMFRLRNQPCLTGCSYCNQMLDAHGGLKKYFGFDAFRTYGGEPLQEKAVKAAINNRSILAVFPTGGGKSITFQVPALMSGETSKALTVVISPLQSLMKDQVDNLENVGITDAVTINGLLDTVERAKSFERVEDGSASMLYLSPESLRSRTIERLLLGRKIARFVIDEAHCFSSWGQDFRVDYLYIGDFIRSIQEKKNLEDGIPVSCFTATAKQKVIEDIRVYFSEKLGLDLELFTSTASRTNLRYQVFAKGDDEEKYQAVRDLIEEKDCPTIIYVSRTRKAYLLAERLTADGFTAKPYHGKMDAQEKTANQNAFLAGEVPIMVATSAFGMGVDKKDVGRVIHYEISDSLENYIQEAGRAGRDENIVADCYVLYNEEDLGKHFILLNQTKLSIKEIQQVWKAIKEITRFRSTVSNSALEIARKAGWDDNVVEIETRVTTAIAALEDAGYLKRGQNMPRVFANSILAKSAQEAIDKIHHSPRFTEKQKEKAVRIIRKLFSSKSRKQSTDDTGESRIDYISDHLGIVKEEVIAIINLLREEKILADGKDLKAFIQKGENQSRSEDIVKTFYKIERFLLSRMDEAEKTIHLKELNEEAQTAGIADSTTDRIKRVINFWAIKNWIRRHHLPYSRNHVAIRCMLPVDILEDRLRKRYELAIFMVKFLHERSLSADLATESGKEETLVEFSVLELKEAFEYSIAGFGTKVTVNDVEDALFYLSRMGAIKIEGGFLVLYNRLTIERLETDNKKRYTKDDYQRLDQFYENKVHQIHIVGEYAKKMINDYRDALQFVEDYFQLNYSSFLRRYFPGSKADALKVKMTPAKFRQLFGELSPTQLKIIKDNETKYIVVAAGPGSGKTKLLVHKLASLLLMEDVKHEQLLMLTFSRAAATEFKKRLLKLIGNAANFIEIKTFHSYCFDLLGKMGSLEKSDMILQHTVDKIRSGEVEASRITKTVLVIDEAQDINADEFSLIKALMTKNEDMCVIAVGDDDQNIYEFRGADPRFLQQFLQLDNAIKYELIENYRSMQNLVGFSNQFVQRIGQRIKSTPVVATRAENGKIKVVRHQGHNLITPLVNDVLDTGLTGTTCILTKTNDEASQITGLLLKNGLRAKLIQTNDGFNLYNLAEVRYFLAALNMADDTFLISDDSWSAAKRSVADRFKNSTQLEVCTNLISDFEATNPKRKYRSDLAVFIRESKLEDFLNQHGETIFVSTIHKAKGKEFDHVFIMLERFIPTTDETKRQLYVAMTRAKRNLTIHVNADFLDSMTAENLERVMDRNHYPPPEELAMHLTYQDVWLDYFINKQHFVSQLVSGDNLIVSGNECLMPNGQPVLKFSKKFLDQIAEKRKTGYELKAAKVNFVLHWRKEGAEQEVKVVLPEVLFERT
ncbi:RecQ family ATP-dependent DNA helicase [Parapedobacter indicus]|uniref:DNA 3'-5' helicase n=1 Tax=Parapedobacter indicus TaxID=1477437 RepID=A0A1I3GKJ3_9SPHI|nr:RecQ family ATP-dependent DNA helicase [Parapedobacter indicus]PPL02681.1 ATP-dependent DNA helicase RecQ [Parapedobacter indicus]SFI23721.1 ATP-dependent DNA helicase RecQ [Parapedobacter indicus]